MFICGATLIFLKFLQVIYAELQTVVADSPLDIENDAGRITSKPSNTLIMTQISPTIISNNSVNNENDAAKKFAEIERNQVLPLVLNPEPHYDRVTLKKTGVFLYHPVAIRSAETLQGRMVTGTEFLKYRNNQLYFCPKLKSEDDCLVPQSFEQNQILECAEEASPAIQVDQNQLFCGVGRSGVLLKVFYDICWNPNEYATAQIEFYSFCHNPKNKYTTYTSHIILSPYLLSTYLLFREHNMEYPISVNDDYKPSLLNVIKDDTISDLNSVVHPDKQAYKLQTLVPPADMAMALWRKTTYQNFNLSWQHEKLIPLWDRINEHVREYAVELFREKIQIRVRTGVFDINSEIRTDDQMYNTWIKIISTVSSDDFMQTEAVAILMNNFVGPVATVPDNFIKFSNETEELEENLCKNDSCTKSLQDEFGNVGARVSCCLVTSKILNLFHGVENENSSSTESEESLPILYIPGVNFEILTSLI